MINIIGVDATQFFYAIFMCNLLLFLSQVGSVGICMRAYIRLTRGGMHDMNFKLNSEIDINKYVWQLLSVVIIVPLMMGERRRGREEVGRSVVDGLSLGDKSHQQNDSKQGRRRKWDLQGCNKRNSWFIYNIYKFTIYINPLLIWLCCTATQECSQLSFCF